MGDIRRATGMERRVARWPRNWRPEFPRFWKLILQVHGRSALRFRMPC